MRHLFLSPIANAIAGFIVTMLLATHAVAADGGRFPFKPIKLIVYTKPGGPIDLTARRFVDVARQYTDATFVVENKSSAGGIAAFEKVLRARRDGHMLCACTKSNISKLVSAGRPEYLDGLDWVALMMIDRECIITRRTGPLSNWDDLIADMKRQAGRQVWVGPASGGLDHVVAMQVWDRVNSRATWIPHSSGGEAVSALLRGEGVAYVGNPSDVAGLPDLQVAVVSSPERLAGLPDIPTFQDVGLEGLDDLYMWRGFALKKGTPPAIRKWYDDLFRKVAADKRWRGYWEKDGIEVVYQNQDAFEQVVAKDREEFNHYLSQLQMIPSKTPSTGFSSILAIVAVVVVLAIVAGLIGWNGSWARQSPILIPLGLSLLVIIVWGQTAQFPSGQFGSEHSLGAAGLPRLWSIAIIALSIVVIAQHKHKQVVVEPPTLDSPSTRSEEKHLALVGAVAILLVLYLVANLYLGYFVSTFLFLVGSMWMLGERRLGMVTTVTAAWLVLAYVAFQRVLYVPLPQGRWWENV